jgi:hypothetical protein
VAKKGAEENCVAGKSLYEILGVPENADADGIRAAHAAALVGLGADADPSARRIALTEALRVLSDERLRRAYDARLQTMRAAPAQVIYVPEPQRSSFGSFGVIAVVLVLLAVPAYFYNEKRVERLATEKAAEMRRAEAKKKLEELEARRAEQLQQAEARNEERRQRMEESRQRALEQQDRARGAYNTMVVNRQLEAEVRNAEREREQQRRNEEMQRVREENDARMRLENDKRRLRALQCANGPC